MFESLLPAVTLVALGLLVPSGVVAMLLARGRHASASAGGDRGGRVAVAAGVAAGAGGVAGWLLGAGPVAAAVTAVLLAAPVVVWAFLAPWWPVRAVVAWAMLVTGSVGLVAMAAARALDSANPWSALLVAAVGATVVVLVLERLNGPFRRLLGIRAGIRRAVRTPIFLRASLLRPALAMAVFFAALAAGGLTGVAPGPGERTPEAGSGPGPDAERSGGPGVVDVSDVRTVSAETATPSEEAAGGDARSTSAGGAGGGSGDGAGSGTSTGGTGNGTDGGDVTAGGATGATSGRTDGGGTGDTSGETAGTGSSGGSEGGGAGGTGGTQDDPVRQVTDTVSTVVDTVEEVTDPVVGGGGSGGSGGSTLDPVESVVEETVEPVRDVVEDTVEPVQDVVEDTVGDTVDQVTDPIGSALP